MINEIPITAEDKKKLQSLFDTEKIFNINSDKRITKNTIISCPNSSPILNDNRGITIFAS
jgi:hypothetical protein